jgi:hypothetical protein
VPQEAASGRTPQSLDSSRPAEPWLKDLVETTLELHRVSHSMERPKLDEEWLESQRSYHSLDLPLPAVLLYFRPETPSWRVSTTNANTGVRRRRNPT